MDSICKKDLKIISFEFRSLASRVLNSNVENGISMLARLITFIDDTEVIRNYVHGYADEYEYTPISDEQKYLYLGDTLEEEIAEGYHYFKYLSENCNDFYRQVTIHYGGKGNNGVKAFFDRIVHPFISDISEYLTRIEIKMGYDEETKYTVIANGENIQLNIAEAGANQSNEQHNGVDAEKLSELILAVKNAANDNEIESIEESLDTIQHELLQIKPKKSLVNTAFTTLKGIKGTAEFVAAIAALYQFVVMFM